MSPVTHKTKALPDFQEEQMTEIATLQNRALVSQRFFFLAIIGIRLALGGLV